MNIMFQHFGKILKFGHQFWTEEKLDIGVYCFDTLWVEHVDETALSLAVQEIEAFLCFCIFGDIRKFKMAAILDRRKYFGNWAEFIALLPCGPKVSTKLLYL